MQLEAKIVVLETDNVIMKSALADLLRRMEAVRSPVCDHLNARSNLNISQMEKKAPAGGSAAARARPQSARVPKYAAFCPCS